MLIYEDTKLFARKQAALDFRPKHRTLIVSVGCFQKKKWATIGDPPFD